MRRFCLLFVLLLDCGRTVVYRPRPGANDAGVVMECRDGDVALAHATPSIFFVLDRSGSMAFDLAGNRGVIFGEPLTGPTRWQVLQDSMAKVLPEHQRDLAMGAVLFPSDDRCNASATVDVMPATGNATAVQALFQRRPGGGTPISAALEKVRAPAVSSAVKSIVLITDGEPNCNSKLDPARCTCTSPPTGSPPACGDADSCLDDTRTVATVTALNLDAGVITHVVGFATSDDATVTLNSLAIAGGAPKAGVPSFYSAATQAELQEVLDGISERETNCTWTALTRLTLDDEVEVRVAEKVVPVESGWSWVAIEKGTFVLRGEWCDQALAGARVAATLKCK